MFRTLIGGVAGGLVLFVAGFLFWGTPLAAIAYAGASDAQNAAVQQALATNLTPSGTGAYLIPAHGSAEGAVLYAKGPIATIFYNTSGYSPDDMSTLLPRLVMGLIAGLLFALGLATVAQGRSFGELARLVVPVALGFTFWAYLSTPILNHYGWGYWIYAFVAESLSWVAAGLAVAWFLARGAIAPEAAAVQPTAKADKI